MGKILPVFTALLILVSWASHVMASEGNTDDAEIGALIGQFASDSPNARDTAINRVVDIGKDAIPFLIDALGDDDTNTRFSAATALGGIGSAGEDVIKALLYAMGDRQHSVAETVKNAFRMIGVDAIPILLAEAPSSFNDELEGWIKDAIVAIGPDAVPILISAANGQNYKYTTWLIPRLGDGTVEEMLALLDDEDYAIRQTTVYTLRHFEPEDEITDALKNALDDENSQVRDAASSVLVKLGFIEEVESRIVADLLDEDPEKRKDALRRIGKIPPSTDLLDALGESINRGDPIERPLLVDALCKFGKEAVPLLVTLLQSDDREVRKIASSTLKKIGADAIDALPALIDALDDWSYEVRINAANTIGRIGPAASMAIPKLANLIDHDHHGLPEAVIGALGRIGPVAIPVLTEALNHRDSMVKRYALGALGNIGPDASSAVDEIIKLVKDENKIVRRKTIETLEMICTDLSSMKPALLGALDDEDKSVRLAVVQVMRENNLFDEQDMPLLLELLEDEESIICTEALSAMTAVFPDPDEYLSQLMLMLDNEDSALRKAAIGIISSDYEWDERKISAFAKALSDPDSYVRMKATDLLIHSQAHPDLMPYLVEAIDDENERVRKNVISLICRLGTPPEAVPLLLEILEDGANPVMSAVVMALGNVGDEPGVVDALVDALSIGNLQYSAINSLGQISLPAAKAVPHLLDIYHDSETQIKKEIVKTIGKIGSNETGVIELLFSALGEQDEGLHRVAADALAKIDMQPDDLIRSLVDMLMSELGTVRAGAVLTLSKMGTDADMAKDELIASLEDIDPSVRAAAAYALGFLTPGADIVQALTDALDDNVIDVVESAVTSIGGIGPLAKPALPKLIELADENSGFFKANVVYAIGHIGYHIGVIPALIRALDDPSSFVRYNTLHSLARLGTSAKLAIPRMQLYLENDCEDDDDVIRANYVLYRLGDKPEERVSTLITYLYAEENKTASTAASYLGYIGPEAIEALPKLRELAEREAEMLIASPGVFTLTTKDVFLDAIAMIEGEESTIQDVENAQDKKLILF